MPRISQDSVLKSKRKQELSSNTFKAKSKTKCFVLNLHQREMRQQFFSNRLGEKLVFISLSYKSEVTSCVWSLPFFSRM